LQFIENKYLSQRAEGSAINNRNRNNKERRAILDQVNALAWLLDNSISVPFVNYRVGLDSVIGLIPGFGDVAGLLISSIIVVQAMRLGVPRVTLMRMVTNITIEAVVGLVPLVGDLFDATYKANARNVQLLNDAYKDVEIGRNQREIADRGFIAGTFATLGGLILLIGTAGFAVLSWVLSLFQRPKGK
jgi:hypothetical protein